MNQLRSIYSREDGYHARILEWRSVASELAGGPVPPFLSILILLALAETLMTRRWPSEATPDLAGRGVALGALIA